MFSAPTYVGVLFFISSSVLRLINKYKKASCFVQLAREMNYLFLATTFS